MLSPEQAYATNFFKKKYFQIGRKVKLNYLEKSIYHYWVELLEDYEKVDKVYLMDYIRKAFDCRVKWKYDIFLTQTLYWQIISSYVKATKKCCEFFVTHAGRPMEVHHYTYDIFGTELLNMDKLICLCSSCHEGGHRYYHPEMVDEPRPETEYEENFKEVVVTVSDEKTPIKVDDEKIPIKVNGEVTSLVASNTILNSMDVSMEAILLKGDGIIHNLKLLAYMKRKNGVSQ